MSANMCGHPMTADLRDLLIDALVMSPLSDTAGTDLAPFERTADALLPVVAAHVAPLREALEKIAATHERNRWHPDTNHPTELSQRWHDGYISCAAEHSIIANAALDPEQAAENARVWRVGCEGSDSDWWRETGHCGHCGIVASSCDCDGECGCWEDHGPPLKPWRGVIEELKARAVAAEARALREAADDWDRVHEDTEAIAHIEREYRAGGPSAPTIWLRERADRIGGDPTTRCHCGAYPVSPDHCLTLFDRDDTAVERHAVGACEGGA